MNRRRAGWVLGVAWAVYLFLHLPVLVLVVFSFNASKYSVEWTGFTLDWYRRLLERTDLLRGLQASLIVGSLSTLVATLFGTLLALALVRRRFRGRRALEGACGRESPRLASKAPSDPSPSAASLARTGASERTRSVAPQSARR